MRKQNYFQKTILVPEKRVKGIASYLKEYVTDPRDNRGKRYEADYLLQLSVAGLFLGAKSMAGIEKALKTVSDELSYQIDLGPGLPSHDCLNDLLVSLDPVVLRNVLEESAAELLEAEDGRQLACDGTAVRAARDRVHGQFKPDYIFNVVERESKLVLSAQKVGKKENEKTVMPEVLNRIDLKGAVVTADALNNSRKIMQTVVEGGGDFVFGLKDEHKLLKSEIISAAKAKEEELYRLQKLEKTLPGYDEAVTYDTGHGRYEKRRLLLSDDTDFIDKKLYPYIKQVGLLETERSELSVYGPDGQPVYDTSHTEIAVATSLEEATAAEVSDYKRGEWSVECFHYLKDNFMGEDRSTARNGNVLENLAILRRIAYNYLIVLKQIAPETEGMTIDDLTLWLSQNLHILSMLLFGFVADWADRILHYCEKKLEEAKQLVIEEKQKKAPPPLAKLIGKKPFVRN